MQSFTQLTKNSLKAFAALSAFAAGAFADTVTATVDGAEASVSISTSESGAYDITTLDLGDTTVFSDGEDGAYLVTVGDSTYLVGDKTLKRWLGNWESWQPYIYPDEELLAEYPYLETVWDLAYDAYIAAFAAYGYDMTTLYPNTASLKEYWYEMTYTNGVEKIKVTEGDGAYMLHWLGEDGDTLAADSYTLTGKVVNGLEGAQMYVFTADNLADTSVYKYFVSMEPDMEGTDETPIAAHYHFQFGNNLDSLLLYGELYNSTTKNVANKYWYATMINEDASALAKYNVILGMHQAEKWSSLPDDTEESSSSESDAEGSSSGGNTEESSSSDEAEVSSSSSYTEESGSSSSDSSPIVASKVYAASKIRNSSLGFSVYTNSAAKVSVYNLRGSLVKEARVGAGETQISGLDAGVYMVKLSDGTMGKVRVTAK